ILLYCVSFSQEWSNLQSDKAVSIDFAKVSYENSANGINHERIVFKYTNLTNSDLKISFQRSISYDASGALKSQDKTYELTVPANSSVGYNDENMNDKTFYIFSKDLKGTIKRSLTNFEI